MVTIKQQAKQNVKSLKESIKYKEEEQKKLTKIIKKLEQGKATQQELINAISHYRLVPYGIDHQVDVLDLLEDEEELLKQLKAKQKEDTGLEDLLNDLAINEFYLNNMKGK